MKIIFYVWSLYIFAMYFLKKNMGIQVQIHPTFNDEMGLSSSMGEAVAFCVSAAEITTRQFLSILPYVSLCPLSNPPQLICRKWNSNFLVPLKMNTGDYEKCKKNLDFFINPIVIFPKFIKLNESMKPYNEWFRKLFNKKHIILWFIFY